MFTKKYILTGKLEDTYKIDPSPSASDAIEAFDVSFDFNRFSIERNVGTTVLGSLPSWVSTREVTVNFKTFIKTNGTDAGMFGKMLRACAFSEASGVYSFSSDPANASSITFWFYLDGLLTKVNGCRGTFKFSFKAGEFPIAEWTFKGLYNEPTASNIITPDWETGSTYTVENEGFTLGSNTIDYIENLEITQEGLESFYDINGSQGFGRTFVTDASFKGSMNPEVTDADVVSYESAINNSNTYSFSFTHGSTTGNKLTFSGPALQITDGKLADKRGIQIMNLNFELRTNESGASPLTITVS